MIQQIHRILGGGGDVDNASSEVSLEVHSALVKELAYHLTVVLLTEDIMESDKPVLLVNLPHVGFIGSTKN